MNHSSLWIPGTNAAIPEFQSVYDQAPLRFVTTCVEPVNLDASYTLCAIELDDKCMHLMRSKLLAAYHEAIISAKANGHGRILAAHVIYAFFIHPHALTSSIPTRRTR